MKPKLLIMACVAALSSTASAAESVTTYINPTLCVIEMAGQAIECHNAALTIIGESQTVAVGAGTGSTFIMFVGGRPTSLGGDRYSVPLSRVRLPNNRGVVNSAGSCLIGRPASQVVSAECVANADGGVIKLHLQGYGQ